MNRVAKTITTLTALLLLAGAALLLTPGDAGAEPFRGVGDTRCSVRYEGQWVAIEVAVPLADELCYGDFKGGTILDFLGVPADQPLPAMTCTLIFTDPNYPFGRFECQGFYSHNLPIVPTQTCVRTDTGGETGHGCPRTGLVDPDTNRSFNTVIRVVQRPTNSTRAAVPTVPDDNPDGTRYQAGPNHRAVQYADGQCYREFRENNVWYRSGSYGSGEEACRQASWNAYQRSRGEGLYGPNTTEPFPAGNPPGSG